MQRSKSFFKGQDSILAHLGEIIGGSVEIFNVFINLISVEEFLMNLSVGDIAVIA